MVDIIFGGNLVNHKKQILQNNEKNFLFEQKIIGFVVTIYLVTTPPLLFTFELGACHNIPTFSGLGIHCIS